MPLNIIWLDSILKDIFIESKNVQIEVRMKKLWPIEVWQNFECSGLRNFSARVAKFRNSYEYFGRFVKLSCILCFHFLFLFFMFNPLENS